MNPERLRAALQAFLADEARSRIARWRADPASGGRARAIPSHADDPAQVVSRHAFLSTREAADLVGELAERCASATRPFHHERGRVTAPEAGALAAHLRRYARERVFASMRRSLRDLQRREVEVAGQGSPLRVVVGELFLAPPAERRRARVEAVERSARVAAPVLRERHAAAEEAAAARRLPALPSPDAGPERTELVTRAEALLGDTRELLEEGLDWLAHRRRAPVRDVFDLLPALRARDLDDVFPVEGRYRRLGAFARGLGLEAELARRVRVDASHGSADPRARLVLPNPPFDVRIGPSFLELGGLSELGAANATGRALVAALAHPELPVELRWPLEGTVGRAVGSLLVQWAFDDVRLARERRAPAPVLDHGRRLAAFVALLSLRRAAAALTLRPGASPEEAAEAVHRALGLPCSPALSVVLIGSGGGSGARLRGELAGLALWAGLRDRFDEDWFRNPRARDVFRGAGERGGGLAVEVLLAELGVPPERSTARLREWFRG